MRPFCIATIGAILGIIMGLYLQSITFFVLIVTIFFNLIFSIALKTYIKTILKVSLILITFFLLFYCYTTLLERESAKINQTYDGQEVEITAIITSDKNEEEYKDVYEIEVTNIEIKEKAENKGSESGKKQKNKEDIENSKSEIDKGNKKEELIKSNLEKQKFKMLLNIKKDKNSQTKIQYGDKICFTSVYEKPLSARNEGGFDYQKYLKTKKIIGIANVNLSEVKVLEKGKMPFLSKIIHDIKNKGIESIREVLPEETANLCTGLLLGEKSKLSENIQEDFKKSNLSHMLAISGAHVSYILLGLDFFLQKLKTSKKLSNIFLILFLIFFMALVGFTPSVTRSCIMAILQIASNLVYRKSDTYQNLAISCFIILLFNPYTILDIGFELSFGGTIGIVLFSKKLQEIKVMQGKITKKLKEMCSVTIAANIFIIPIMMYHFNTISFTFLISNIIASPILGVSLILGMIFLVILFICKPIAIMLSFFLQPILQILIKIANISGSLPFSQILIPTPKIWQILLYYILLALIFYIKRVPLKLKKYKKVFIILIVLILISPYFLSLFKTNQLTISFIDVGQGDSCLIQTPYRKTILIDGGGSEMSSFDVGEKTLLPYLLDKGIMKIDYMIFSHFDSDHCQRPIYYYGKNRSKKCNNW